jgi:transposase
MADSIQTQRKLTETLSLQANFEREKLIMGQQQAQQLQEQRYLTLTKEKELQQQQYLTLEKEAELQQFQAVADQQRLIQLARQTDLQRQLETQTIKAQAQTQHNQQQNQIRTLQLKDLETRLRLQENTRNFGFTLASLIGLSLLGYTQLLRKKNKALRLANEENKAALLHGQTQEMMALRAQMNPHFYQALYAPERYRTSLRLPHQVRPAYPAGTRKLQRR